MFEVDVNGLTQQYRSKPVMNVDITKPLTYDYMPEGYPKKDIGAVTLMEEQEVAFAVVSGGTFGTTSPVILDVKSGDKLTVVWDGVIYNVTVKALEMGTSGALAFGNLGLIGVGDAEDYPFLYAMDGSRAQWGTADTSTTHTIKVMRQQETYTPMSKQFMPSDYPNEERVTEMINTALGAIENGSY